MSLTLVESSQPRAQCREGVRAADEYVAFTYPGMTRVEPEKIQCARGNFRLAAYTDRDGQEVWVTELCKT